MYTIFIFVSCCLKGKGPLNLDQINMYLQLNTEARDWFDPC